MKNKLNRLFALSLVVFCFTITVISKAEAEMFVSGYLGVASTHDSDVKLNRPGGTNLTFSDVSWDDNSFDPPFYYGLRVGYWFKNSPNWGTAIDLTHAKMYSELNKTVSVSGTRSGASVSDTERLGDTFEILEFTDGHNLLTLNGMYRWTGLGDSEQKFISRLQPYMLAGLGIAIPHVEVAVEGDTTLEFQYTGLAALAGVGLDIDITRWFSLFAEYRLSYSEIDADLVGGGTLKTKPWTHHLNFGVTFSFLH